MRQTTLAFIKCLSLFLCLHGLLNGQTKVDELSQDEKAWQQVIDKNQGSITVPGKNTSVQLGERTTEKSQNLASLYQQTATKARDFYTAYPNSKKVAEAKKLEAVSVLQSVQAGGVEFEKSANVLGAAYRADKKNSDKDRYDVALTMETISLSAELKGKRLIDDGKTYEKLADKLHLELGDTPEVAGLYLGLTRTTDLTTSINAARKIQGMKKIPPAILTEAQSILDRSNMIGRQIDLQLTTAEGQDVNFKDPSGKITVVLVWDATRSFEDLIVFSRFRLLIPSTTRFIYIGLGQPNLQKKKKDQGKAASFSEIRCFESSTLNSLTAERLKLNQLPYIYVLDSKARLVGFGRLEDLVALFNAASKK